MGSEMCIRDSPKGMAALQEVEDELDKAKAEVKTRTGVTAVLDGL